MSANQRWESVRGGVTHFTGDDGRKMVDLYLEGVLPGGKPARQTVRLEAWRFDAHYERTLEWAVRDLASRGPIL